MLDNIRGKVGKMSDEILIAADRIILDVCIKIGKLCIVEALKFPNVPITASSTINTAGASS